MVRNAKAGKMSHRSIAAILSFIIFGFSIGIFGNILLSVIIAIASFIAVFIVLDGINAKDRSGRKLGRYVIIAQFICAIIIGAIAVWLTFIVASAILPPRCSILPLTALGSVSLLGAPILFAVIISYVLHRISGYNYAFLLVSFFVYLIIGFSQAGVSSCNLIPQNGGACFASSGLCQNPVPYNNAFSIILSRPAGGDWRNVSFIWLPQGGTAPAAGGICPALDSNTAISGLSCGTPNFISLAANATVNETFSFKPRPLEGVFYSGNFYTGEVWAEYQNASGGDWRAVRMAYVEIRELSN